MKIVKTMLIVLWVALLLWFVLSWCDILAHNDPFAGDYQYHNWNMFTLVFEK